MTPEDGHEQRNQRQFDNLAASYDRMGFLTLTAQFVADQVDVQAGQDVMDVMTGTGSVALALAAKTSGTVRVVGTDLSDGMLGMARTRAAGVENVSFVQADATALPFGDASFDVVVCASGLFFVPDMVAALREWRRVVRPGGAVLYSSFGPGLLGTLPGLWRGRLGAHGVTPGFPPLGRIPTLDAARELLVAAGLEDVTVTRTDVPYVLADVEQRWGDIEAGLEGQPLSALSPDSRARVEAEHRAELAPLFADGAVTVPLPVIVARGTRGQSAS
ncbi:ubiquinone/menaquinone biosynthesis C-methylase UbiE [Deinococcus metalli]|uniref:Methyltransferase n=1 Tax=Deinococcus metalli TaxID=1141878 RepID=A0A7W8NP94_9DEIO|nr:class I SAM-dependent methyltransferase [Deinococcus metalli]MBB5377764.1 ubiquinone/menaquinone biosynthesis C-methylase UbiE [Deinococcus metalli]GHF53175.1 methyltransferase [Deinococcus metalli]